MTIPALADIRDYPDALVPRRVGKRIAGNSRFSRAIFCRAGLHRDMPRVHCIAMTAAGENDQDTGARRNRAFAGTHQALIEGAVRLISEKGVDSLSIAGLSRMLRINRTTVYYHFASREALLEAVSAWSATQLASGFSPEISQDVRIDFIARFVVENPDLIKLWIDDFVSPGDIRDRYPKWDDLVAGIASAMNSADGTTTVDAEVYCAILLTGAIIGPRVFRNSIRPDLPEDAIVERFRLEQQRMLARDKLLRE